MRAMASRSGTQVSMVSGVEAQPRPSQALVFIVALTAIVLNSSGHLLGFNLSLADPLIVVLLGVLLVTHNLLVPPRVLVFFVTVVVVTLGAATFVTPALFGVGLSGSSIVGDLVKMTTSLLFVVCGYSVAALGLTQTALRWFAWGAGTVALAGVAFSALGVRTFDDALYYAGSRFSGLMADPNYYAVLACAAIAYFVRSSRPRAAVRVLVIVILSVSIVLSGSKTGVLALALLAVLMLIEHALAVKRSPGLALSLLGMTVAIALLWGNVVEFVTGLADQYGERVPQLVRLAALLGDAAGAASADGSSRVGAWDNAIEIIQSSPILGIGIGSYSSVGTELTGTQALAHNTYLQLAAEWGIPLAVLFFAWLALLLIRTSLVAYKTADTTILTLRDTILVLLIGSISLSLNNARMFWFFLGMMIFFAVRSAQSPARGSRHVRNSSSQSPGSPNTGATGPDAPDLEELRTSRPVATPVPTSASASQASAARTARTTASTAGSSSAAERWYVAHDLPYGSITSSSAGSAGASTSPR